MSGDEDEYTVPLRDQRVFGAGIRREKVRFIPSSNNSPTTNVSTAGGDSVADRYLSLVLSNGSSPSTRPQSAPPPDVLEEDSICDICKLPLQCEGQTTPHEATLAHQVSLQHVHPPSAIDRNRKGLSYLQAYGWDPDSRAGLGASGEGALHPIKPKAKNNTAGLGLEVPKRGGGKGVIPRHDKVQKLSVKDLRKKERDERRKADRLRRLFYDSTDVINHLGIAE